eukprot:3541758-Pleurochrysis_carterae.AAC.1
MAAPQRAASSAAHLQMSLSYVQAMLLQVYGITLSRRPSSRTDTSHAQTLVTHRRSLSTDPRHAQALGTHRRSSRTGARRAQTLVTHRRSSRKDARHAQSL